MDEIDLDDLEEDWGEGCLGTSIQFSERRLLQLEHEVDTEEQRLADEYLATHSWDQIGVSDSESEYETDSEFDFDSGVEDDCDSVDDCLFALPLLKEATASVSVNLVSECENPADDVSSAVRKTETGAIIYGVQKNEENNKNSGGDVMDEESVQSEAEASTLPIADDSPSILDGVLAIVFLPVSLMSYPNACDDNEHLGQKTKPAKSCTAAGDCRTTKGELRSGTLPTLLLALCGSLVVVCTEMHSLLCHGSGIGATPHGEDMFSTTTTTTTTMCQKVGGGDMFNLNVLFSSLSPTASASSMRVTVHQSASGRFGFGFRSSLLHKGVGDGFRDSSAGFGSEFRAPAAFKVKVRFPFASRARAAMDEFFGAERIEADAQDSDETTSMSHVTMADDSRVHFDNCGRSLMLVALVHDLALR